MTVVLPILHFMTASLDSGLWSSCALTASQARSKSAADASVTVRPPAFISVSTFPKRRVNFSEARRRQSSASMPRSRATLTIENSKSPSSSATRASSPPVSASWTSPTSSPTLLHASCQFGQSKPTRAALLWSFWARSRAGSDAGTPSRVEPVEPASSRLIRSHWARASRESATASPPNTCGCRRVILSQTRCSDVIHRELPGLGPDLTVEDDLEQQIPELLHEVIPRALIDGVDDLVRLLDDIRDEERSGSARGPMGNHLRP